VQPFSWVPGLFDQRNALKRAGDPRNIPLKLGLNSLYGKTAQGEGQKDSKGVRQFPPYQSYVWAGLITSMTRARIIEAIGMNPGKVLNAATDGIFSRVPLALPNRGKGLGDWDEEDTLLWFELYGNGVYRGLETNHKNDANGHPIYLRRARGVEDRSFDYDSFGKIFAVEGCDARMQVNRHRFRGYKISSHRHNPDLFCTWGEENTTFHALTHFAHEATEIEPHLFRVESIYRRSPRLGMHGPDRSFPEPYIARGTPLTIAPPFACSNYDEKLLAGEQPD
jgi:hypothetical protein